MKFIKFFRSTKVTTNPQVCLEVMYDYTHFLYKHKSSFNQSTISLEPWSEPEHAGATSKLSWASRIISIPVTRTSYSASVFFEINMPINTTLTHFFQLNLL